MVALLSLLAYLLYALAVAGNRGKQTSSVNDVIHYECMLDIFVYSLYRTLQVRKISGIFPEKFRKVSDILFFRKSYNPSRLAAAAA